jgi:hypothetical protein
MNGADNLTEPQGNHKQQNERIVKPISVAEPSDKEDKESTKKDNGVPVEGSGLL